MKKEGIQTRNRKSASKHGAAKLAGDGGSVAWSMLEPMPQHLPAPSSSRPQPPYHFKAFPSSASSDEHRPSLPSYCVQAPTYPGDADAVYPVAYAHAQQVPGDYASMAAFGGAGSFSVGTAGYSL